MRTIGRKRDRSAASSPVAAHAQDGSEQAQGDHFSKALSSCLTMIRQRSTGREKRDRWGSVLSGECSSAGLGAGADLVSLVINLTRGGVWCLGSAEPGESVLQPTERSVCLERGIEESCICRTKQNRTGQGKRAGSHLSSAVQLPGKPATPRPADRPSSKKLLPPPKRPPDCNRSCF